jgi:hypothetical protein
VVVDVSLRVEDARIGVAFRIHVDSPLRRRLVILTLREY